MSDQKKECGCVCSDLLIELIKQNNQLIQINNEQNAQINELLIKLEGSDEEDKPKSRYLDG